MIYGVFNKQFGNFGLKNVFAIKYTVTIFAIQHHKEPHVLYKFVNS